MVIEKKIFYVFSYYKSMEVNDPRGVANLDPRAMIGRIYEGYHYTLLHTKYEVHSKSSRTGRISQKVDVLSF